VNLMKKMKDFRCAGCRKLLARTNGDTEVKCPRCGALNTYNSETGKVELSVPGRSERTTSSGIVFE